MMPHRSSRRALLPIVLLALGVYLLAGCIYIPMFGRTTDGKNVSGTVGGANSRKSLRVARSTRDDVLRVLGPPHTSKLDGSAVAYTWRVQNGVAIWPFCFMADSIDGTRTLVLRFDEAGKLQSYNVLKRDKQLIDMGSAWHTPPLPEDFREEGQPALPGSPGIGGGVGTGAGAATTSPSR